MTEAVHTDALSDAHAQNVQSDDPNAATEPEGIETAHPSPVIHTPIDDAVFIPAAGAFVHPVARPGHIAYTLLVVDPSEVGKPPIIGSSYMKVAFPDLNLPEQFNLMSLPDQERIWDKLNEIILVRNESVVPIEAKGLCFVSEEWILEHYPHMILGHESEENGPERPQNLAESSPLVTIHP
ncbi:MAG: hypothetical protein JSS89_12050 [Bacteroidetes bacterium]|nr:hypothetical protein [Bacteroidota bacterium]